MKRMHKGFFGRFANAVALATGHPAAFIIAVCIIVLWLICGPIFGFSDTWQLIINTTTTIITFLMVFLIQSTQNRDGHAMQLKLDELIRSIDGAHLALLDIEELSERELASIRRRYQQLADRSRAAMRRGESDTGSPEISLMDDDPSTTTPEKLHGRKVGA